MTIKQSLYLERLNAYGTESKDGNIQKQKQMILNNFTTHPSYQDVKIETVDRGVHIVEMSSLEKIPNRKRIMSNPDETLETGNYVEWNSIDWLIVNIDDNHDVDYKGVLVKCESKLNWVDSNGIIQTFPCTREEMNKTSLGGDENKYMIIGSKLNKIFVQSNEFTDALRERDGLRFIFDEMAYKGYHVERHIPDGVVSITLEEDEINFDTDKLVDVDGEDLWIADYTEAPVFVATITTGDVEVVSSSTVQLDYSLTEDGQASDEPVTWSSDNVSVATVDSSGLVTTIIDGTANITVEMTNNSDVNDSVVVDVVAVPVSNVEYIISPNEDGILLGQTITFNVEKYDNGVLVAETFTFSVNTGLTTAGVDDYVLTTVDSNNFTLENVDNTGDVVITIDPSGDVAFDKTYELKYFY